MISPKKEKYMMLISEGKMKIFAIKDNFESNFKCFCDMHDDNELLGVKKNEGHQSFFGFFGNVN